MASPIQHFRATILEGWRSKVSADLCVGKGFRGGPWLDVDGSLQLLNSGHVRERDKALLRSILVGGVWAGFLLHEVKGQRVPCRFCGGVMTVMVTFSGNALFHLWLRFVSFMISWSWISRLGHGVCFGMVGFLFFLGSMEVSPWAGSPREGACDLLLGRVALLIAAVVFGRIGCGATLMKMLMRMLLLVLVEVFRSVLGPLQSV